MLNKNWLLPISLLLCLSAAAADRSYVLPENYDPAKAPPFSNGVLVGDTFYVAGHLGLDATGKAPADTDTEVKLLLEAVKVTLGKANLGLDDLVSVTIYCTDLALYDKFNAIYRTYFHDRFPSRAFIGAAALVRGAHFEIQGIAVKGKAAKK